ncbi:MAG: iron ABC transporter permease [Acidimicrobiaceae bacterium]|nr:iron ABC transporter permease [Acidimicrobiaceae bacterium]
MAVDPLLLAPPGLEPSGKAAPERVAGWRSHAHRAPWATGAGAIVALVLLGPLAFLIYQAQQVGWQTLRPLVFRHLTLVLLWHTVELALVVGAACAVLGTAAAWLVERTELPGRRVWAVVLVLPLAIPDFIVGYAWNSAAPAVHGFRGAVLVMTLALYPLVYLPVAAALRRADPSLEETARSLGLGPVATFFRVTVRQIRPAITGGCLVVTLALLAEYGAFEILRFQTFTTEIFAEFNLGFATSTASALAVVLVLLSAVVLAGEAGVNRGGRIARSSPQAARLPGRRHLGRMTIPALLVVAVVVALGVGMPVGTIIYWMASSHSTTLPGGSLASALWHTVSYGATAALLAAAGALPIAIASVRHRSRLTVVMERSTFFVQALPGIVIALSLVYFVQRHLQRFYQHPIVLVVAYAMLFFPLALVCVRASVAQAPTRLEEAARALGRGPLATFVRVTLPLVAPGLAAGFCLVFLSAGTELTATLLLVPTGAHTLATQFWAYQTNTSYGAAAPYAAVIVGVAAVPSILLSRWFDKRPGVAQ